MSGLATPTLEDDLADFEEEVCQGKEEQENEEDQEDLNLWEMGLKDEHELGKAVDMEDFNDVAEFLDQLEDDSALILKDEGPGPMPGTPMQSPWGLSRVTRPGPEALEAELGVPAAAEQEYDCDVMWFVLESKRGRRRCLHRIGGCGTPPISIAAGPNAVETVFVNVLADAEFNSKCDHCFPLEALEALSGHALSITSQGSGHIAPMATVSRPDPRTEAEAEVETDDESSSSNLSSSCPEEGSEGEEAAPPPLKRRRDLREFD